MYKSLHVENSTKMPVFSQSNSAVADAVVADLMMDYSSCLNAALNKTKLLVIAGEYDMRDGPNGQEKWMK